MKRDLRGEPLYAAVAEHFRAFLEPGLGKMRAPGEIAAAPDGAHVALSGEIFERLGGIPQRRVRIVDLHSGEARDTSGPGNDRAPQWSPSGATLAFLSDRDSPGTLRLYVADASSLGNARAGPALDETVESFAWSPDGSRILLQTAGLGADVAGTHGSGTYRQAEEALPSWAPFVEDAIPENMWRRLRIWDVASEALIPLDHASISVWEACWCGDDAIAAVVSDNPREGAWYGARLEWIDARSGARRTLYAPAGDQIGVPRANRSGDRVAVILACCSDRMLVAGDVLLVDVRTSDVRRLETSSVDVTDLTWRDDSTLFYIGVRGFETVAGQIDVETAGDRTLWTTRETCGGIYPAAPPLPGDAFAVALESYERYPSLAIVENGEARMVHAFADSGIAQAQSVKGRLEEVTWQARDGLEIGGYLALPRGRGPHPLVVLIHGGPVWAYRNTWWMAQPFTPLLIERGYAVLHPNPRGSAGRGQEFARLVRGDVGGEDVYDLTTGVEELARRGLIDAARVAVTGRSYGGYLSAWIVTQCDLFAAAIPMAPATDNLSLHFTCNIPEYDSLFYGSSPYDPNGRHYSRSPVFFAHRVKTPTLTIAGALDRCTPPSQALEFHRALVENGVVSELVVYPEDGHFVRGLEAQIDLCARMLIWLERYVPVAREAF